MYQCISWWGWLHQVNLFITEETETVRGMPTLFEQDFDLKNIQVCIENALREWVT